MKRIDKVPREQLRHGNLLHVMTPHTALRWAMVRKVELGYAVERYDLRCELQSTAIVSSLHLAATIAKRFAREAA